MYANVVHTSFSRSLESEFDGVGQTGRLCDKLGFQKKVSYIQIVWMLI